MLRGSWRAALVLAAGTLVASPATSQPASHEPLRCVFPHHPRVPSVMAEPPPASAVAIVIDASASTLMPAGFDVNRDGYTATWTPPRAGASLSAPPEPADSVLAAEVWTACEWVRRHLGADVRVALITFSGDSDGRGDAFGNRQADAVLRGGPTSDGDALAAGLNGILAAGSNGATNYAAAIDLARQVLHTADGVPRRMLLLTDGLPTLPEPPPTAVDAGDRDAALRAAHEAAGEGIVIDSVLLGDAPIQVAEEVARVTGGASRRAIRGSGLLEAAMFLAAPAASAPSVP